MSGLPITGSSSGYEMVTTSPRSERLRCLNVVVSPCASRGRYIRPVRPSFGSSIHLMLGSSDFIENTNHEKYEKYERERMVLAHNAFIFEFWVMTEIH